jgi:hypothetical protein
VPIRVDGTIDPTEWAGAKPEAAVLLAQDWQGQKATPTSRAWLAHDGTSLCIAFDNTVDPAKPMQTGAKWAQDDAVEVAIRNPAGGASAPILVLRGYAGGHLESSEEAGAPSAAAQRALQGVEYKPRLVDATRWTAEWRIPFASLGIDPAKQKRFPFSLSVRKTANNLWLMWHGTGTGTWDVDKAGVLELAP